MRQLCLVVSLFLFFTTEALAAVSINEVAWMGGTASANHEWIELYNSGSEAVSVVGWILEDGMNLSIPLSGSIAPGSYAVLERSSDDSAPGAAFLLYTGALVNTGATLVLKDEGGVVVDQVAGGSDWKNIGGDNATKETAQYTSTGWVTDTPTPGAVNRSGRAPAPPADEEEEVVVDTGTTSTSRQRSGGGGGSSAAVRLRNTETVMTLSLDVPSVAYVNQTITFSAAARGNYDGPESMVRYSWNFGDGHATSGKRATHRYAYPGHYVITVHGKNGQTEQTERHEITVLPVTFSITRNVAGDVQLHNDAQYDIDLSGYTLRGTQSFIFPPRTIMAARGTITLPATSVGGMQSLVALYDGTGTMITSTFASLSQQTAVTMVDSEQGEPAVPAPAFSFGAREALAAEPPSAPETILIPAAVPDAPAAGVTPRFWYLLLITVFGGLFALTLLLPKQQQGV